MNVDQQVSSFTGNDFKTSLELHLLELEIMNFISKMVYFLFRQNKVRSTVIEVCKGIHELEAEEKVLFILPLDILWSFNLQKWTEPGSISS